MRFCLIPIKPLTEAKARLGPALKPEERKRLSLAMLADVVHAARSFDRVWVLQSDPEAAETAAAAGAEAVADPAPGLGLNQSLERATTDAVTHGATGVLIVAADVPSATSEDLVALASGAGIAVAPDAGGSGTNALWRMPGNAIPVAFGGSSRVAHEALARHLALSFRIVDRPRLAADVDTPDGLAAAWALGVGEATRRALNEMGLPARLRLAG